MCTTSTPRVHTCNYWWAHRHVDPHQSHMEPACNPRDIRMQPAWAWGNGAHEIFRKEDGDDAAAVIFRDDWDACVPMRQDLKERVLVEQRIFR